MDRVVVVGAGMAGARTCQELLARGFPGELVLIGAEGHPPYDRPPLSKGVLRGEEPVHSDVALDPVLYAGATTRFGEAATGLREGVLETTGGHVDWDGLVLAVGAAPIRLPGDGSSLVLRTIDDAVRLRAALRPGARVVVVGAGWIGAEVATAAAGHGCAVTALEAAATPLAVPLGTSVGARTAPWYEEAGIDLHTSSRVVEIAGGTVRLEDGREFTGDVVVEGVGVRRDLDWLAGSGVEVDDGVLTDPTCRTSLPSVLAVGDCAARWSPRAGRRFRLEHWDDALNGPAVAARMLMGERAAMYDPVPYVWSEQFGRYVQWVGWRDGEPTVWRGDPAAPTGWSVAWLDGSGRMTGLLAVDRPRDLLQARKVIAEGIPVDAGQLADPDVPVKSATIY